MNEVKTKFYNGKFINYRIFDFDDLLDTEWFYSKKISFREIFEKETEEEGKEKAKEVICEFLDMLMEDMIMNNSCFILPMRAFGYIRIGERTDIRNSEEFNFKTMGKGYSTILHITSPYMDRIKIPYKMDITGKWKDKLDEEVNNGHKYFN